MIAGGSSGIVNRSGGGAHTNLNTKPGGSLCMQVTPASSVSQHNTTTLSTVYLDEWVARTLKMCNII